ncbi:MAG: response regulator [Nonlabens sp.]|nr:response regulator [Nonlabens sp.]
MARPAVKLACIIDDDKLYVSLIKMIIAKHELAGELLIFENGQAAFEYFEQSFERGNKKLPEIILLDLNMPVMDGWEFLDAMEPYAVKFQENNITINVVSSTINPVEVERAKSHSIVADFLTKPISKEAMQIAFQKK